MSTRIFPIVLAFFCIPPALFVCQAQKAPLTAREMFYAGTEDTSSNADVITKAQSPAKAPQQAKTGRIRTADSTPRAKARRQNETSSEAVRAQVEPDSVPEASRTSQRRESQLISVGYQPQKPLGLKYTILKQMRTNGQRMEVDPDTVFRAGDRIQLNVEVNDDGYLYIVSQGSSGTWKPIFPSPEISEGSNRVQKGQSYIMPPGHRITFDEQPGAEKLFILFSRQPEPDLEKMVYSLSQGQKAAPATNTGSDPAQEKPPKQLLLAQNVAPIDDALVRRFRETYVTRDLIIEKDVEEEKTSQKTEKLAVYAVNKTGSNDSRVVADVSLKHE